jgi:hypothetical protein
LGGDAPHETRVSDTMSKERQMNGELASAEFMKER